MAIQKPAKQKREDDEYNFHVIDRQDQRENLISVSFIIPRNNVKKAAISLYRDLLQTCSKVYFTRRSLARHLASLYGASLTFSLDSFDRDFVLSFSIVATDDNYIKTFKNLKSEMADVLINLIEKGYSRDEKAFELAKDKALSMTAYSKEEIDYIATSKFVQNFLPHSSFNELSYGSLEEVESLTFLDVAQVEEEIKNADRMVVFIGNPEARTALKLKKHFDPTSFIPSIRVNPIEIAKPADLKVISSHDHSLLLMGFRFPSVHSENDYVVSKVAELLIKSPSVYVDSRLAFDTCNISVLNGLGALKTEITPSNYDTVLNAAKKLPHGGYIEITEEDLVVAKRSFKRVLLDCMTLIEEQERFIYQTTFLNISHDVSIYLERLESLTLVQMLKFFEAGSYIGSIFVEGEGK